MWISHSLNFQFILLIYVIVDSGFPVLLSGLGSVTFIIYFDAQIIPRWLLYPIDTSP